MKRKQREGQSLMELLIGLAVGAVFIIGAATVIAPSIRTNQEVSVVQTDSQFATEMANNVRVWATNNWSNVLTLATGTTNTYTLSTANSPFSITGGTATSTESFTVQGIAYTRSFYLSDTYRDSSGNVTSTIAGNNYDPSTKFVTVVVAASSTPATTPFTVIFYITRNQSNVFSQTSWVGGSGQSTSTPVVGTSYATSVNIGTNATGSFQLSITNPQLIRSVSSSSTAASSLALPAFGTYPTAGDLLIVSVAARSQSTTAPTDSGTNSYTLIASSTISGPPSSTLSLYYAINNSNTSSSFVVTVNGVTSTPLSGAAFEYSKVSTSSPLDTFSVNTVAVASTSLTSNTSTATSTNELYFGALAMIASTTASSGANWTAETSLTDNNTRQALYNEDISTSTKLTTAATWTSAASTNYGAILGIFKSQNSYAASGTLDSATLDTRVASGTQLNSLVWWGSKPSNSIVEFQFAVSNSSSGPWTTFVGPDGSSGSYFIGSSGAPITLTSATGGLTLFNGYRYFRYRTILFADSTGLLSPVINAVSINWSP
jgi:hypothetical protein